MMYFIYKILRNTFRPALRSSSEMLLVPDYSCGNTPTQDIKMHVVGYSYTLKTGCLMYNGPLLGASRGFSTL